VIFTNMVATGYFLSHALDWGVVTLAILFQPELRSLLERVGRGKLDRLNIFSQEETRSLQEIDMRRCIDIVTAAVANMAATRMGSIIVLERKTRLGDIIGTGTTLNADLSEQLLLNVFYPKSPLHDGAVILRLNRLYAAGCLLPLSQNHSLSRDLGTRHRAAIGVTEVSDAVVIVVSEESGIISLAVSGVIRRRLSPDALKNQLTELLITAEEKKEHTFASLFRKRVK
jgi:diadenylate cyclase